MWRCTDRGDTRSRKVGISRSVYRLPRSGLVQGRAFFVWRRGGQPSVRGETVIAATVDEKRLGRNRYPDAALWGLNRGGCRGGREIRLCGARHGS